MCAVGFLALTATVLLGTSAQAQQVRLGGFVQLDRRLDLRGDSVQLADFYNVFRPELSANFEGRVDVVVSLDVRFYDFTGVRSSAELAEADQHFPSSLSVWEAQVRLSGFLLDPLDLTIGKQRVQWGTADGLNPTDRMNTYDLSDLTDFTARVPTWAIRAEYYVAPDWRFEAVWLPTAHAPLLPVGAAGLLAGAGSTSLPGPVASWEEHFEPPTPQFDNSLYGLKAAGHAAGLDVSLSYFHGLDGIPEATRLLLVQQDAAPSPTFDGHAWSVLPHLRVLGADMATEWRGVGLWAEGAVAFPEMIELVTDVVTRADSMRERLVALEARPYATWTVGGEYTFAGGWYLNLQWAHGLFLEHGADQLHDYLVGRLERRLLRQTLTLTLTGAGGVAQWSDWTDHLGFGVFPEVAYSPVDNIDVSLGAFLVDGRGASLFSRWGEADQLYVRAKASF